MPPSPPQDPHWPQVGQSLGPWLILRHHDLEGSGDMFLAKRRDGAFEREVLITLQRPTPPGSGDDLEFLAERELQGRLDHPGIAKVLGAGRTPGGLPYLVTEYLDGIDVEQHLQAIQAPVPVRLEAFQQVCQAVQHAHTKGIIGLNLQASNVHLMPDGSLRIVVFGLAQWNQVEGAEGPLLERPGWREGPIFAGEYASPEQWLAKEREETSDVYSLGVLLYRLLTGSSPQELKGLTPAEARTRVQQGSLEKASARVRQPGGETHAAHCSSTPRQLGKLLSGDLDRVLAKALCTDSTGRYASASEFSEDLDRHLAGQPIRARGPAPIYALGRGLRRYRIPVALFLSVVLVLGWALRRSYASSQTANEALLEARSLEAESEVLGQRLRDLCVRFLTELGPGMQGRPGLEEARRYLLNVGAPLLDHLRGSGHADVKLALHLCRSYAELAEADYISRDVGKLSRTPESARKALSLCTALIAQVPASLRKEAFIYYARAVRSAVWFSCLTLDTDAGQAVIDNIPIHLASVGTTEEEQGALTQMFFARARRAFYESQINYEAALEAWDLDRLRGVAETNEKLLPFFEADYSYLASLRAGDLMRAGRRQEALYELPPLIYQMSEEIAAHNPPVLSLLGNETSTWIDLASVRIQEGMPPGEALIEASRHLETIRKRFTREPGAKLILVNAELGLGDCKLRMGPQFQEPALAHLDRALQVLQTVLRQGSRWPRLRTRLARIQLLRAQVLFNLERFDPATIALQVALQTIEDLPQTSVDHSQVIHLRCLLRLEQIRQLDPTLPADWTDIRRDLQILRQRGVSEPGLLRIEQGIARIDARYARANQDGGSAK